MSLNLSAWEQLEAEPAGASSPPPMPLRALPEWANDLGDEVLKCVLTEMHGAVEHGFWTLAAAGARILIDQTINITVSDQGSFRAGLSALKASGRITASDETVLAIMVEAGNAAAHRGWRPSPEQFRQIQDTVQGLLHRIFIQDQHAAAVKSATPLRRPRPET